MDTLRAASAVRGVFDGPIEMNGKKSPYTSAVFVRADRLPPLGVCRKIIMMTVRHVALLGEQHATLFHLRFII